MTIGGVGVYLLEASVLLILFYIFNKQLLGRETLHRLNRYLWLTVILVSLALPFCSQLLSRNKSLPISMESIELLEIYSEPLTQSADVATEPLDTLAMVLNALFLIYVAGVVAVTIFNLLSYGSLIKLVSTRDYRLNNSKQPSDVELLQEFRGYEQSLGVNQRVHYIVHDKDLAPFSWLNFVVVSRSDLATNSREIIIHELSHVAQYHSLDVMLLNLLTIILWFNPASWLTKRALQQVHEYCADESVLSLGVNAKEYQLLLIRKAVGSRLYTISNSLNHSNLKNRITMMLKKKSSRMVATKCIYAIPVAIAAIALFTSPAFALETNAITRVKFTNYFTQNKIEEPHDELNSSSPDNGKSTKVIMVKGNNYIEITSEDYGRHSHFSMRENDEKLDNTTKYIVDETEVSKESFTELNPERMKVLEELERVIDKKLDSEATITGTAIVEIEQEIKQEQEKKNQPFLACEVMPTFQGGDLVAFRNWVMGQVVYPEKAAAQKIQGTVLLKFIIERDGSIVEVEPLKSPNDDLTMEAKRVVLSSSGMWSPGTQNGETVRVTYSLPIVFAISDKD